MSNKIRTLVAASWIMAAVLIMAGVQPAWAMGLSVSPMAPEPFGKILPKDGATGISPAPTLSWEESLNATSYEYCVYQGSTCPRTSSTTDTGVTLSGLAANTTYHWQVVALDWLGRPTAADGGAVWSFTTGTPPGAFSKSDPTDGSLVWLSNPTLIWEASSGATGYYYCYATTNPCTMWTYVYNNTSVALSGLPPATIYYWEVQAANAWGYTYANGSNTDWSFATGYLPGGFSKSAPANGATNVSLTPTLSWGASWFADSYDYCIGTTNPCNNWTNVGTNTSAPLTGLSPSTAYYWEVVAHNSFGDTYAGGSNTDWSFTTGPVPGAFSKSTPANGTTSVSLNPTLSWGASSGAASYEYCFYSVINTCTGLNGFWTSAGSSTSAPLSSLSAGTTYHWQVRAVNAFGNRQADSGTWWLFTTGSVPGPFSKSTPTNGSMVLSPSPTLSWGTSSGATAYYYCYGTINPCSNWASAGTSTSASLSALSAGTTYYWQVRADNAFGSTYANGSNTDWSFTTGSLPGGFNLTSPASAATGLPASPTLSWEASSDATLYGYCYGTTSPCSNWFSVGTSTSATLTGLSPNTTYYWEVKASNAFGDTYAGGSNTDRSFTTGSLPGTFNKLGPAKGATGVAVGAVLTWAESTSAATYSYCISTANPCTSWTSASSTSVTVPGLKPSTSYYWEVKATNSFGTVYADGSNSDWYFTTVPSSVLTLRSIAAQDGTIVESAENSSKGWQLSSNWTSIKLGDDNANRQLRVILSFQTSALPPNAVITAVTLKVKKALLVGSNPFNSLGNILVDIKKGAFGTGPALQIGDFQAPASRAAAITIKNNPQSGWYRGTLGVANFGLINRSNVTQFRLRFAIDDNNNHVADFLRFYSGDYTTNPSFQPTLVIWYYVP